MVGGAVADFPAHVVGVKQGLPEIWVLQLVVVIFGVDDGEVDAAGVVGVV